MFTDVVTAPAGAVEPGVVSEEGPTSGDVVEDSRCAVAPEAGVAARSRLDVGGGRSEGGEEGPECMRRYRYRSGGSSAQERGLSDALR